MDLEAEYVQPQRLHTLRWNYLYLLSFNGGFGETALDIWALTNNDITNKNCISAMMWLLIQAQISYKLREWQMSMVKKLYYTWNLNGYWLDVFIPLHLPKQDLL